MGQRFEVVGKITHIETIAVGSKIRQLKLLQERYGKGRWRKCKGIAQVRFEDGRSCYAEIHWYEAHGIGRLGIKIKAILDG
ncbi:MAG: hypothetical protein KIT16_07770 [Rhodospirillaceae bacterium]|nr:hypothetical protein [Rhodospirillaceae bacterium]